MLQNNIPPDHRRLPWKRFQPDFLVDTVADIDFDCLQRQGIKVIFIDLDGTVVEHGTFDVPEPIKKALHDQPLDVYIATNRPRSRSLKSLQENLHASGVIHPRGLWCKPFPRYFHAASRALKLQRHEIVMVGDRYLQDVWGANSAGLNTIAVRKLGKPVGPLDRLISHVEARRARRLSRRFRKVR